MNKLVEDAVSASTSYLKCLVDELDCLIRQLADKFNLFYNGRPRKAFILDVLLRYGCLGCIVKALTKQNTSRIDDIYTENHRLAVNLLCEQLKAKLKAENFKVVVEEKVPGNYGKMDIVVKSTLYGLQLQLATFQIVVEVKCGKSLRYSQLFRYFLQDPSVSVIVVWRVTMHQIIVLERAKISNLLPFVVDTAIRKAQAILNDAVPPCEHSFSDKVYTVANPQVLVDDLIEGMSYLPEVVNKIVNLLKSVLQTYEIPLK